MPRAIYDLIPETALDWHRSGKGAALATVVQTWGSAPRPVGSQLAISGDGQIAGSVSGGCVEGAVVIEAQEALEDGRARIVEYGISDDDAFSVGLACGGTIRVMIEPIGADLPEALLADLVARREGRAGVACVVDTATWERRLTDASDAALGTAITERMRADQSGFDGDTFIAIHNPPLRLAVIGAVHIAQPLLEMARLTGYDVTLIDPRPAFATEARFPGTEIVEDYPDEVLTRDWLDMRTALVTLSHDPKIDDPAIVAALRSDVFYLGSLGSTRTHAKRVVRLQEAGFSKTDIGRIHAPIGLNIGAKSPAEIAIAIMAELTEVLRRG